MNKGTVKWFNNERGYGFITDSEGKDTFFHHSSILMDGFRTLDEGDIVEFEIGNNEETGREQAINVLPILTRKMVEDALKEEDLHLRIMEDSFGVKKYLVINKDNVLQTSEQGMTLEELAGYAGLHYPM